MPWDRGYYNSAWKVDGRVVRAYWDGGLAGEIGALADEDDRAERAAARSASRARMAELDDLEAEVAAADRALELAALAAAGYRRHKRGEWRKKRGPKE
jgi:hypothetical protein